MTRAHSDHPAGVAPGIPAGSATSPAIPGWRGDVAAPDPSAPLGGSGQASAPTAVASPSAGAGQVPAAGKNAAAVDGKVTLPRPADGETYTIELPPGLRILTLNGRQHWRARNELGQVIKDAAIIMARKAKVPHLERVTITAEYRPPDRRRRDADNIAAAVKYAIDGIIGRRCAQGRRLPVRSQCHLHARGALLRGDSWCCTSPRSPMRPRRVRHEPPARGRLRLQRWRGQSRYLGRRRPAVGVDLAPAAELPVRVRPRRRTPARRRSRIHVPVRGRCRFDAVPAQIEDVSLPSGLAATYADLIAPFRDLLERLGRPVDHRERRRLRPALPRRPVRRPRHDAVRLHVPRRRRSPVRAVPAPLVPEQPTAVGPASPPAPQARVRSGALEARHGHLRRRALRADVARPPGHGHRLDDSRRNWPKRSPRTTTASTSGGSCSGT